MSNNLIHVGILQLEHGKTYGRQVKSNGKPGKLYYGIIPGNKDDVPVKVAYEPIKSSLHSNICNIHKNRFVSYKITQFLDGNRSIAILVDNYGTVDNLDAFIKYRLHLKNLDIKPKFGKNLLEFIPEIRKQGIDRVNDAGNVENISIMTIDPEGCMDIDDGVGLTKHNDGTFTIFICITHLPSYLLSCKVNLMDLSNTLVNPCSIYLPGQTINMFDEKFSLNTFSLKAGRTCPVLALCLDINELGEILGENLTICNAYVTHNYAYDSPELNQDLSYSLLLRLIKLCFAKNKVELLASVNDSHDVVAYLMILMNSYCGKFLKSLDNGIFRQANPIEDLTLPEGLQQLKHIVCNRASKYICSNEVRGKPYVHITSPMRRLPDLINMMIISHYLLPNSEYEVFKQFIESSLSRIEQIDALCKAAKKIGDESTMLHMLYTHQINTNRQYEGIIIERLCESDNIFSIFIEEIGRWFRVKSNLNLYKFQVIKCRLVLFENATTCNRKLRICLVK